MNLFFSFKGSIGRIKFICLFSVFVILYSFVYVSFPTSNTWLILLRIIILLATIVSFFSIIIRRLHDIGKESKDILLIFIPIYNIYVLFKLFTQKGINQSLK